MAKSYKAFLNKYLGQKVDVDAFPPAQPYQCWDYVSGKYFPYIGGHKISCTTSGYVKDIANNRKTNGILDFCDDIGLNATLQPGDICIWGECAACPSSHIALYDHDNGQNEVYFSGQYQPYTYVTIARIPVSGIIAVFRPKIFANKAVTPAAKKPDQILTKGSKVTSYGFYIEKINYIKDWGYNSWVGGWFPLKDVVEVDKRDGKQDQIVHIGSGVAFKGTMTVSSVNVKAQTAYIKELGYSVKSRCLCEVKDGN